MFKRRKDLADISLDKGTILKCILYLGGGVETLDGIKMDRN
jgi:hypothetical protein